MAGTGGPVTDRPDPTMLPAALLCDRRGTLTAGHATQLRAALERAVAVGVRIGIIADPRDEPSPYPEALHVRAWCPHDDATPCGCRRPDPGLVLRAAAELGVEPSDCLVVSDAWQDLEAAAAVGAPAVLVGNAVAPPAHAHARVADVLAVFARLPDPGVAA